MSIDFSGDFSICIRAESAKMSQLSGTYNSQTNQPIHLKFYTQEISYIILNVAK